MKTCTIEDLIRWDNSWALWDLSEDEVQDKISDSLGVAEITALDILRSPYLVPDFDKLCWVLREELVDAKTLREFACDCAEHVLPYELEPCWRAFLYTARRHALGGATDAELGEAQSSARQAFEPYTIVHALKTGTKRRRGDRERLAATIRALDVDAGNAAWSAATWAASAVVGERPWQLNHLVQLLSN